MEDIEKDDFHYILFSELIGDDDCIIDVMTWKEIYEPIWKSVKNVYEVTEFIDFIKPTVDKHIENIKNEKQIVELAKMENEIARTRVSVNRMAVDIDNLREYFMSRRHKEFMKITYGIEAKEL